MAFAGSRRAARRSSGRAPRRRSGVRRLLRGLLWLLVAIVALPHLVLLAYRIVPPPITPLMAMRLVEGEGLARRWTPLEAMAPALVAAVMAAEDNRFCSHRGVDWVEMRHAIDEYRLDIRARGASTITMQTVKNLVLWPGRDVVRKGIEIYLAHYLELIWPKARIMEVYLNVAEWGPGIYGAEAAARQYFGKPAADLTRAEASLLAGMLPNPRLWRPDRPTPYLSNRAAQIVRRADQLGPLLDCVAGGDGAGGRRRASASEIERGGRDDRIWIPN